MALRHLQIIAFPAIDCLGIVLYSVLRQKGWYGIWRGGALFSNSPRPPTEGPTAAMSQEGAAH